MAIIKQLYRPRVSIVLPTYNRESYLQEAVESVLSQDYNDYELLIIDDGSTDGTARLVQAFNDERIVYIKQQNRGEYSATNVGFKLCKGEFVTIMHSDDVMPSGSIRARVHALSQHLDVDFCHGDITIINREGIQVVYLSSVDWPADVAFREYLLPVQERKVKFMVHFPTIMIRRKFFDVVGCLDESLPWAGDFDWMMRALARGKMAKVDGILYKYRHHGDQRISHDPKRVDIKEVNDRILQRFTGINSNNK